MPATFGMLMDVDDELRSVNGTVERASAVTAVVASVGSSKGIVINEPDMCRLTVTNDHNRFPEAVDITAKGKRKVGDASASVENGIAHSFFVVRCAYIYAHFYCHLSYPFLFAGYEAVEHCVADVPFIGECFSIFFPYFD